MEVFNMTSFAQNMLEYLEKVANANLLVNGCIHILVIVAYVGMSFMKNQVIKSRIFHLTIFLLFASVTVQAALYGNPVHLATFALLAIVALIPLFKNTLIEPVQKVHKIG